MAVFVWSVICTFLILSGGDSIGRIFLKSELHIKFFRWNISTFRLIPGKLAGLLLFYIFVVGRIFEAPFEFSAGWKHFWSLNAYIDHVLSGLHSLDAARVALGVLLGVGLAGVCFRLAENRVYYPRGARRLGETKHREQWFALGLVAIVTVGAFGNEIGGFIGRITHLSTPFGEASFAKAASNANLGKKFSKTKLELVYGPSVLDGVLKRHVDDLRQLENISDFEIIKGRKIGKIISNYKEVTKLLEQEVELLENIYNKEKNIHHNVLWTENSAALCALKIAENLERLFNHFVNGGTAEDGKKIVNSVIYVKNVYHDRKNCLPIEGIGHNIDLFGISGQKHFSDYELYKKEIITHPNIGFLIAMIYAINKNFEKSESVSLNYLNYLKESDFHNFEENLNLTYSVAIFNHIKDNVDQKLFEFYERTLKRIYSQKISARKIYEKACNINRNLSEPKSKRCKDTRAHEILNRYIGAEIYVKNQMVAAVGGALISGPTPDTRWVAHAKIWSREFKAIVRDDPPMMWHQHRDWIINNGFKAVLLDTIGIAELGYATLEYSNRSAAVRRAADYLFRARELNDNEKLGKLIDSHLAIAKDLGAD